MLSKRKEGKPRTSGKGARRGSTEKTKETGKSAHSARKRKKQSLILDTGATLDRSASLEASQQALRESEKKYRALFEKARDGIVLIDAETGEIIDCNPEFENQTGRKLDRLIKMKIWEVRPPEKVEAAKRKFFEIRKERSGSSSELEFQQPKGGIVPVEFISTVITLGDREYIQSIVRDITDRKLAEEASKRAHDELEIRVKERTAELTEAIRELQAEVIERKRAEEKLRESEENYKTLVETSNDMIFTVDLKGNFLFTNRAFGKVLGYSAEEITKINGFDLVHPEDLETVKAQFARLVEGHAVGHMEYRYRTKDGSYIRILNNASPVFGPQGNVVAALGAARDISGRKRAEEALQESELWMRNMFKSLDEAVFVVTPDRTLVNINQAAQKMFGYTKSELADLSTEVLHVDHQHYVDFGRRIKEAFDKEETASFEFEAKRKSGEIFPTEHTVSLLKNDTGESLGIVSVIRDISERKRAEEELNQYRQRLEELVDKRTADLRKANERLEQEIAERKQAEEELERELAVNRELARLSGALIAASASLDDMANIVLDSAKSLTQSEHGFVASIDPKTLDTVAHTLTKMMGKQCLVRGEDRKIRFPVGADGLYPSLWGHALNSQQAFLTNTPDKHEASRGVPGGHIPIKNFLSVPAVIAGELVGQIALANSLRDYTDRDLEATKRLAELYAIAIQRKRAEEEVQKRTRELDERVKELDCLYGIASLVQKPGISLEEILEGTLQLIPPAWRYPEITCARVVLEGQVFKTKNFRETIWRQTSDIVVRGNRVGTLEVYYLEEKPEGDEGPFLAEERSLINAIAERLARITERKKGEQEIEELNESLKLRAAELAAANKELEAFSYSVSHDLRAPLRTVEGFSRALMEDYSDKLDSEGKDYLTRVRAASQHMRQLIDDLLNLSLTVRREMRREETNLSEIAHAVTAELKRSQPERQVEFVIQEGVLAYGDPRLFRDVLENLLGNAWKFTEKHPRAKIEFGLTEEGGQKVYFVRDDGAGFDKAYVDKLFVPFQRLHSTAEFSGNGVGLAVVSRIINRHGGRIWAEGEVEKGATFYFTLS